MWRSATANTINNNNYTYEFLSNNLPKCLAKWRNESIPEVIEYSKEYREAWRSQNETICKNGRYSHLAMATSGDPQHFPHFAIEYFTYISLLLWQDVIFQGQSCLRHYLVDEEAIEFWTNILQGKQTWVVQLLRITSGLISMDHLASTRCAIEQHNVHVMQMPSKKRIWFFHGSEATWLGSAILGEQDACASVMGTRASRLAKSTLIVTMLQRDWARSLLNPNEIIQALDTISTKLDASHGGKDSGVQFNASVVNFEGMHLQDQVRITRDSDIVLSVHGAGLTNWGFLRPCAIAIELLPLGLGTPPNDHYFGVLVNRVGAMHYSWTESKSNSPLVSNAWLDGGYDCRKLYNPLPDDASKSVEKCWPNKYCRACSRLATVRVNTTTLGVVLKKALTDRQTCLKTHPLYA